MAAANVPAAPMSPSNSAPDDGPVKMEEMPPKDALTPPASEENNNRARSNSPLSDLDMEDMPELDPIQPDHYFEGGKVPVFKPVRQECCNTQRRKTMLFWKARKAYLGIQANTNSYRPWSSSETSKSSSTRWTPTA